MKKRLTILVSVLILLLASVAWGKDSDEDRISGVVRQDATEARADDIARISRESGLPLDDVDQAIAFQEAFSEYADNLIARYPNQVSAIWTEPVPHVAGHVRFTDDIPAEIAPEYVIFTGEGRITIEEHARRANLAAMALRDNGYRNFITAYDPVKDQIQVEMQIAPDALAPTQGDIFGIVQHAIFAETSLSGDALVLEESDLSLVLARGEGNIIEMQHSRGGNWLLDDGVRECTSGWSVGGPGGDGIITAAHCTGLNQFEEPGVTPYAMSFQDQERGAGGDVEYHTTSHVELAEFYSTATAIRDVSGFKTTNTMVGNSVCVYGRSSNSRSCLHSVDAVNVTVVDNGGFTVGNLAQTDNITTIGGDSGGGWSLSTTAWGVHHGISATSSFFTPIQAAQTALNVTLLTK